MLPFSGNLLMQITQRSEMLSQQVHLSVTKTSLNDLLDVSTYSGDSRRSQCCPKGKLCWSPDGHELPSIHKKKMAKPRLFT